MHPQGGNLIPIDQPTGFVQQPEAFIVLVNVPRNVWCFPICTTRQLIGRATETQIQVPAHHCTVSRRHAEIWSDKRDFWLCDLGSRGGTRVNGVWLSAGQPARILPGDRLTFGDAELRLEPVHRQLSNPSAKSEPEFLCDPTADTIVYQSPSLLLSKHALKELSSSEHNILLWMARGITQDHELASLLHRSPHTIRTHVASIIKKCGFHSRGCLLSAIQRDGAALRIVRAARDNALP